MDFGLWIETEHVEGRIEDFCNVLVTLQTGEAYGLNVWTFAFFAVARRQGEETTSGDIAERYETSETLVERCVPSCSRQRVVTARNS